MRKIFCGVVFLLTLGVGLIGIEAHADDYTYDLVAQPVIYTPTTNQVLNNFPRTAYVSWSGVSGAVSYEIEVDCDVCSTVNWSNQYRFNSDNTNITTYALPGDNQFRVRVRTRFPGSTSDSWTMGAWSEYKYFWFDTSKPCSETDNGVDYSTQGMAFGPDESTGIVTNYFDSCGYDVGIQDQYNGLYLAEKYCSNNKVYTQWYRCSNGCAKVFVFLLLTIPRVQLFVVITVLAPMVFVVALRATWLVQSIVLKKPNAYASRHLVLLIKIVQKLTRIINVTTESAFTLIAILLVKNIIITNQAPVALPMVPMLAVRFAVIPINNVNVLVLNQPAKL